MRFKKTWTLIKQLINKNKKKTLNSKFIHNGKTIMGGTEIVNMFNNFFINIGRNLAKTIPNVSISPTHYLTKPNTNSIYMEPVSVDEILKIVRGLRNSAPGHDELHPSLLKYSI